MRLKILRLGAQYVLHPSSMFYSRPNLDWLGMLATVAADNKRCKEEQALLISKEGISIPVPLSVLVACSQTVQTILNEDPRVEDIALTMCYDAETLEAFLEFLLIGEITVSSYCMKAELEEIWSILGMPISVLGERSEAKNIVDHKYPGIGDLFQLIDQLGQSSPETVPSLNLSNTIEPGFLSDERVEIESKDAFFEQPSAGVAAVTSILSCPTSTRDRQTAQAATDTDLQEVSEINNAAFRPSPDLIPARESRSRTAQKKTYENDEVIIEGETLTRTELASRNILRNCWVEINKILANSYLPSHMSLPSLRVQKNKFMCDNCGETFKWPSSLNRHQSQGKRCNKNKQSTRFVCDVCNKTFEYTSTLKRHQNAEHKGIKRECAHCKETFKHSYHLAKHIREEHLEMLPQCEICDEHFLSESELKRHKRDEHNQPDEISYCSQCSIQFKNAANLRNHMKFLHSGKFLSCILCPFKTKYPSSLNIHMKGQHEDQKVPLIFKKPTLQD